LESAHRCRFSGAFALPSSSGESALATGSDTPVSKALSVSIPRGASTGMQIILRKVRGISGLTPVMRTSSGSFGVGAPGGSVTAFLSSGLMIALVAIALFAAALIAWYAAGHPITVSHAHALTALPVLGNIVTLSPKVKEKDEQLAAKQKSLHDVFDAAGADMDFNKKEVLELVGVKSSTEVVEKVKAMNAELDALGKSRDELIQLENIRDINSKRRSEPATSLQLPGTTPTVDAERERKMRRSIGQVVVESMAFKTFLKTRQPVDCVEEDVETKTAFTTAAGWAPESTRVPGLVIEKATRPIQVLDIIPTGPTAQAAVVYMEETTRTHSAAERAENAVYAESAFVLTQRSDTVRLIGDSVPVTDEQLEDVAQVQSYLNQRLNFGVTQRLDGQIINGDGNAPNLQGIVNKSGIQTQAKGTDAAQDAFYKAMVNVRVTGRAVPSAHIIHPLDWQGIRLQRTADGIYIWGSPAEAGPERMWGLAVAQADSIAQGTGITGDFVTFIQLWVKRGVEIAVGYNTTDFVNGRKTVRAGMRCALSIYRAAAFSTVTGL
jgi:HK97 family phage major capsid protein